MSDYPSVTIMFDDDSDTVYTEGYPRLSALGIKGSIAIITNAVGAGIITNTQLGVLYDAGWSIVSHTHHHYNMTSITDEEVVSGVVDAKANLDARGFTRSSDLLIAPYNAINEHVLGLIKPYIRATTWDDAHNSNDVPLDILRIKRRGAGLYTPAQVIAWVDDAIINNRHVHINFHALGTPTEPPDGYIYAPEDFQEIIEYIAAKRDAGLLNVLTYEESVTNAVNSRRLKVCPVL